MAQSRFPRRGEQEVFRAPLTRSEVEFLVMSHLRHPNLFDEGRKFIKPEHFDPVTEKGLALLWASALALSEIYGGVLPADATANALYVECKARLERSKNQQILDEQERADLFGAPNGLLAWYFGQPLDGLNATHARTLRSDFVVERTYRKVYGMVGDVLSRGFSVQTKEQLGGLVEQISMAGVSDYEDVMSRGVFDETHLTDPIPDDPPPVSTGLAFLDKPMLGGQCSGEFYTLMGPSGVGKTTLAIQMAIMSAKIQLAMAKVVPGHRPGVSCFFTWEQGYSKLLTKAWACAARLRFKRDETPKFSEMRTRLSGRREDGTVIPLKEYELKMFADDIEAAGGPDKYEGELGRLRAEARLLGKSAVRVFDMTKAGLNGGKWGADGLKDVVSVLNRVVAAGDRVGAVYIDYMGLMVDRYMEEHALDKGQTRHYLKKVGMDAIRMIAQPFACSVWGLHQLNTVANRRNPTSVITHNEGEESGQIAQNATYAFQLGTKDADTNACQLYCTKTRSSGSQPNHAVLKIDGEFSRMIDASDILVADANQGRIVPRRPEDRGDAAGPGGMPVGPRDGDQAGGDAPAAGAPQAAPPAEKPRRKADDFTAGRSSTARITNNIQ